MTALELSKIAASYYEARVPKSTHSGFDKYVCTNGEISMFVNSDYEPVEGECVFQCTTRNDNITVQFYKPR